MSPCCGKNMERAVLIDIIPQFEHISVKSCVKYIKNFPPPTDHRNPPLTPLKPPTDHRNPLKLTLLKFILYLTKTSVKLMLSIFQAKNCTTIIIIINCTYKAQHRLQRPQGAQVNTNMNTQKKTIRHDCVIAMTRTLPAYMTSVDL